MDSASIPRPEYPRPEARRGLEGHELYWQNLNGIWDFGFDHDNRGFIEQWERMVIPFDQEKARELLEKFSKILGIEKEKEEKIFDKKINVPFPFQSKLSGIHIRDPCESIWYRRAFSVPDMYWDEIYAGKRNIFLNFGAVDYSMALFIDGHFIGTHRGGLTPFSFDITHAILEAGSSDPLSFPHTITIYVEDPPFDPEIPRGKQSFENELKGCMYERISGIWQTVWLEYLPPIHLSREDYYIRFDLDKGKIFADITLNRADYEIERGDTDFVIEAEMFDPKRDESLSTIDFKMIGAGKFTGKDKNELILEFNPDDIELWSPENPKLYEIRFRLIDANSDEEEPLDELRCSFGFRKIYFKNGKFHLNDRPIYLRMALYQGYWPDGLWTAPSDDHIVNDVKAALDMGFNALRVHQLAADPRFLYWADRMGLMLWGEISNSFGNGARAKDLFISEWSALIRRDRNHPSIIMWTPINESWGAGDLSLRTNQDWLRSLYYWTKSMDPTRPVNTNDGWENPDCSDIISIHDYCSPESFTSRYSVEKPRNYAEFFRDFKPNRYTIIPGMEIDEKPVMLTEWGGWGYLPKESSAVSRQESSWGYGGRLYNSMDEVMELYSQFIEELNKRKGWICGHCYTEFCDQYQEVNGLLTFDRKPKISLKKIREINLRLTYG